MRGNYYHLHGGPPENAMRYLRGGPWEVKWTKYMSNDDIWDFVTTHDGKENFMTADSP